MTTVEDAREAIYSRFRAAWDPADADVGYDNVDQIPPKDLRKPWLRLFVRIQARVQESLSGGDGKNVHRSVGSILVQVFVPRNEGVRRADRLAKKVEVIFQDRSFDSVRCSATTPREIGIDGPWFQMNVDTAFDFDGVV